MVYVLLFSLMASALPLKFQKSAHVYFGGFELDGKKQGTTFDCKAYGQPSKASKEVVLKLDAPKGLAFEFECRGGEVGSFIRLHVLKEKKPQTSVENVMNSGGDEFYSSTSHLWLEDLNRDGFVDLVTRVKARDSEDNGQSYYLKTDELEIYHWKDGAFSKQTEQPIILRSLQKRFDFQFKI